MSAIERIRDAIGVDNCKPKGDGYECRCPAHEDNRASFSLNPNDAGDGAVLHCHANCSVDEVLAALNMTKADLYDSNVPGWQESPAPRTVVKRARPPEVFETLEKAARTIGERRQRQAGVKIVSYVPHYYENGKPFGVVLRYKREDGEKEIAQLRWDGDQLFGTSGEGLWPLYRQNELKDAETVYLHEGEAKCNDAWKAGLPSTSGKGGSNAAKQNDWSALAAKNVVILPDNDTPGEEYARELVGILHQQDPLTVVKIVRLPDRPEKGDFADLYAECQDDEQIAGLRQTVEALTAETEPEQRPQIVPISDKQPALPPFPTDAFPEDFQKFIEQTAKSICCEPVMIANPLLSALATVAGGVNSIQIRGDWIEPLIVWTMTVADSGSKKSPAFKAAMKPLRLIEDELEEGNIEGQRQHQLEARQYETDLAIWKGRKKDAGRKDTRFDDMPPDEPEKYCADAVVVTNVTIEALCEILGHNDRGVLLAVDEAAAWLKGFDRYGGDGGEVGQWLQLHSAEAIRVDRIGRGRQYVAEPLLQIAGGIQPSVLAAAIGSQHVANGLLQRFLVAQPKKLKRTLETPQVCGLTQSIVQLVFSDLRKKGMNQDECQVLRLSPEAYDLFKDFYNRHAERQHETEGAEAGMLAKIEAAAARLAGVLFTAKSAIKQPDNPYSVDAESMAGGIALAEWYAGEWERLYRGHITPEEDPDDALLDYLAKHGGRVKRSKVMQNVRRYRSADILEAALVKFGKKDYVRTEVEQTKGKPAEWLVLTE